MAKPKKQTTKMKLMKPDLAARLKSSYGKMPHPNAPKNDPDSDNDGC